MAEKLPLFQLVRHYGCVHCQCQHFEDTQAEIFTAHFGWQSKDGVGPFQETFSERAARYGIRRNDNLSLLATYREADARESQRTQLK